MADVSGILAAGQIGKSAIDASQQPLTTLQTVQSIINSQTANKLQEQQLDTSKQQLQVAKTNRMSQLLAGALTESDADLPATAARLLNQAAASGGDVPPAVLNNARMILGRGDPREIRRFLTASLAGTLSGADAADRLFTHFHAQDQGGQIQPGYTSPQLSTQPQTFVPSGPPTRKVVGPETEASQQQTTATQQDVDNFAKSGIKIIVGQPITQSMRDVLIKQGHPELLPGGGSSQPAAGGQGGTGGTSSSSSGPINSSGQRVGPGNPASLGPKPGTPMVTAPPPTTKEEQTASVNTWNNEQAASSDFYNRDNTMTNALTAFRNASTGGGTDTVNSWKQFFYSQSPDFLRKYLPGVDIDKIDWHTEAEKYASMLQRNLSGSGRSDMAQELAHASTPNTQMSNSAAIKLMQNIVGLSRMRQAAYREFLAQNTTTDGAGNRSLVPGASSNFSTWFNDFMNKTDSRAFQPLSADNDHKEFRDLIARIPEKDRKRFMESYAIAQRNGFQD